MRSWRSWKSLSLGLLECGAKPGFEPGLSEALWRGERHQRFIAELGAEIPGMNVARDLASVALGTQHAAYQFIEAELLGAGDFNRVVERCAEDDVRERAHDIVRDDGLHVGSRQAYHVAFGGRVGDPPHEFGELRGAQDRVRDSARLDQVFLRHLGTQVAALRQAIGSDDRKRDVVAYARRPFGRQQVPGRGLEELQYRRVFEGRRIRDV